MYIPISKQPGYLMSFAQDVAKAVCLDLVIELVSKLELRRGSNMNFFPEQEAQCNPKPNFVSKSVHFEMRALIQNAADYDEILSSHKPAVN
jgi:hypothetical protein